MDWRNPVGVAATYFTCLNLRQQIKPWNLWSFDDVAVTVNPTTQNLQIVRISKEERARLNKWHLNPGAMPDPDKETEASNVVYKMFNSVNAAGFRGPLITKMLDHDFKWDGKDDQWMAIYCINQTMAALYIETCVNRKQPKYCEIEYFESMFIKVIMPFVKQHRDLHSKIAFKNRKACCCHDAFSRFDVSRGCALHGNCHRN